MKRRLIGMISIGISLLSLNTYAVNPVKIQLKLQQAKEIYTAMMGPSVKNEGAAGHIYREGKSITCRYTNVPMNDPQGRFVPTQDPQRYFCMMQFDQNGSASPAS